MQRSPWKPFQNVRSCPKVATFDWFLCFVGNVNALWTWTRFETAMAGHPFAELLAHLRVLEVPSASSADVLQVTSVRIVGTLGDCTSVFRKKCNVTLMATRSRSFAKDSRTGRKLVMLRCSFYRTIVQVCMFCEFRCLCSSWW
jgi:hypothetical protein